MMEKFCRAALLAAWAIAPAWALSPANYVDQTGAPGMLRAFCLDTEKGRADLADIIRILDRGDSQRYVERMRDPKVECADLQLSGRGRVPITLEERLDRFISGESCLETWRVVSPVISATVLTLVACKEIPNEDV